MSRLALTFVGHVIGQMLLGAFGPAAAFERSFQPPADPAIVNVRDYGALGDGLHDDTDAIQAAINAVPVTAGRTFWCTPMVYFPAGTYKVSHTLEKRDRDGSYTSGLVLVGADADTSHIVLASDLPAFGDAEDPHPVIRTSARLLDGDATSGGKDYRGKGEGNDAYANYIENLTIDVGDGNSGAVALDFLANNVGALRHVRLVAGRNSGLTGLAMTRKWIGPALVSDVTIQGFETGLSVGNSEYGVTLEDVTILSSRHDGLRNDGNLVAADRLAITDSGRHAIVNASTGGLMVIDGLNASGQGDAAIANDGYLTLSNASQTGYAQMISSGEVDPKGNGVFGPYGRSGDPAWTLAPHEPPSLFIEPVASWASIAAFGARADANQDSTAAIQAAADSGAATLYFPFGTYAISRPIRIPPSVRRIVGLFSTLTVLDARRPDFDRQAHGMLDVATGSAPLFVEKLTFDMTDRGGQLAISHSAPRPLVLEDIVTAGTTLVHRGRSGGPLFAANVCCGGATIEGPATADLRQFNSEANMGVRLTSSGAPVRVLGMKVEHRLTVARAEAGGVVEIHGGFFYPAVPDKEDLPLLINDGGHIAGAYVEEAFRPDALYHVHLQSTGAPNIDSSTIIQRNRYGARLVPMITSDNRP